MCDAPVPVENVSREITNLLKIIISALIDRVQTSLANSVAKVFESESRDRISIQDLEVRISSQDFESPFRRKEL